MELGFGDGMSSPPSLPQGLGHGHGGIRAGTCPTLRGQGAGKGGGTSGAERILPTRVGRRWSTLIALLQKPSQTVKLH